VRGIKQIIITITLLAIALALIIGVISPLLEHGADTGGKAVSQGRMVISKVDDILKR
jgi:hypothetical protein